MPNADPVVIVSAARTPLRPVSGGTRRAPRRPALGGHVIKAALDRAKLPAERIDEALMELRPARRHSGQAHGRR